MKRELKMSMAQKIKNYHKNEGDPKIQDNPKKYDNPKNKDGP